MQFFSALVHRFVPSALLVSSRRSSIKHCAAQAWCGPVGVPHICCGIRSRQPCCGEAHHSKISAPSCATVLSKLRRSTPKWMRSEEHTSELQSPVHLVCRLLLEKKNEIHSPASTKQCQHNW